MSTVIISGTMGSTENLNSPIVKFNLTADPLSHKVHGSVEVTLGNPGDKPYKGNVEGTLYAAGLAPYDKIIGISGSLPSQNPLTPLNFPFNAHMSLEANGTGVGGFNFRGQQSEDLPVKYTEENF